MHPAAGVRRRPAHPQPPHRQPVRRPPGHRSEHQQLVRSSRASADVTTDQVRVATLERQGRGHGRVDDLAAQTRCVLLEAVDHPVGEPGLPAGWFVDRAGRAVAFHPQARGASRDAGGVGAVLLTEDQLRQVWQALPPDLGLAHGHLVEVSADVHDHRVGEPRVEPRRRSVEVHVEAEVPTGPAVPAQARQPLPRQVLLPHEVPRQHLRSDVGDDGPADRDALAGAGDHPDRPTTSYDDTGDRRVGADHHAGLLSGLDQRSGQCGRPANGNGHAVLLSGHREQERRRGRAGRIDADVGVGRVAHQQQPGGVGGEAL